jgi:hypothetical protein
MAETLVYWPDIRLLNEGTVTTQLLDATTDQFGSVFYAAEDCTITNVQWLHTSYAGTPGTIRVGLQSVSATTGTATGTWLASGNGYVDKTTWSTGDNGVYQTSTLGTSVTLSRGECFAIVLDPLSGTWDATNNVTIGFMVSGENASSMTPYYLANNNKQGFARTTNLLSRSSSKTYGLPIESVKTWEIDNDVSGQNSQGGAKFMIPATVASTYQVSGIRLNCDTATASSFTIALYEGTNRTVMQTITIDTDQTGTSGALYGYHYLYFDDSTLDALSGGTTYRIMIEALSATSAGSLRMPNVGEDTNMTAYVPSSHTFHWTEWDGSAYVDYADVLPPFQLIITDVTQPTGGSTAANPLGGFVG